jgi:hypothetical protein
MLLLFLIFFGFLSFSLVFFIFWFFIQSEHFRWSIQLKRVFVDRFSMHASLSWRLTVASKGFYRHS